MSTGGFHLFVYGTLRSGLGLDGDDEIRGDVWRCPDHILSSLDEHEVLDRIGMMDIPLAQ